MPIHSPLLADARRGQFLVSQGERSRHKDDFGRGEDYVMLCVKLPYSADLSCRATRENALDAAIDALEMDDGLWHYRSSLPHLQRE